MSKHSIEQTEVQQLSANLRALLESKNMSINELARILDTPVMTIRRLLSGETMDPRISTIKLITDHFGIPVDYLVNKQEHSRINSIQNTSTKMVPIIDWEKAMSLNNPSDFDFSSCSKWHPIAVNNQIVLSNYVFALESRPSMYPRYPKGSLFIIEPNVTPEDGDSVLVKIGAQQELSLRELMIDPPEWHLKSVGSDAATLSFCKEDHSIVGIVLLTILHNRNR